MSDGAKIGRAAVPTELRRRLFEEAGHRCAIPTCKGTAALEMAHIEPWAKIREHSFENMIVLCAVDHTRFDRGEIELASIRSYKANLSVLRGRYNDFERRVLEVFSKALPSDDLENEVLVLPGGSAFQAMYLIEDGLVTVQPAGGVVIQGVAAHDHLRLTTTGAEFVRQMANGRPVG